MSYNHNHLSRAGFDLVLEDPYFQAHFDIQRKPIDPMLGGGEEVLVIANGQGYAPEVREGICVMRITAQETSEPTPRLIQDEEFAPIQSLMERMGDEGQPLEGQDDYARSRALYHLGLIGTWQRTDIEKPSAAAPTTYLLSPSPYCDEYAVEVRELDGEATLIKVEFLS